MVNTNTQPGIQAVIFDMGRVLINIDNKMLVEKLFKGLDSDNLQELGRRTMGDPAMVEFNSGRIAAHEFHRRMCQTYQLDLSFEAFKSLWCETLYRMDGMEDLVASLSQKMTVGLLSDTDPIHWCSICSRWPWIAAIKNPTLSYEVGVMKPNAAAYLAAAENVKTPPPQCLFIDDLESNVEGARAIGMHAIRFEGKDSLIRQLSTSGIFVSPTH